MGGDARPARQTVAGLDCDELTITTRSPRIGHST
jgi:hypothetical protein